MISLIVGGAVLMGVCGIALARVLGYRRVLAGRRSILGLDESVIVSSDRYGIPLITARSRLDAIRALGYVSAHDRLFQMDLLRRVAAGRLSEVMGQTTVEFDVMQRHIGFNRIAGDVVACLPPTQQAVLHAYAEGVNAYIKHSYIPGPEFLALRYRPEPWTAECSILVGLYIFQDLTCDAEDDERMITVMRQVLPSEVVAFLTPATSDYDVPLLGGQASCRPMQPIPIAELAALLGGATRSPQAGSAVVDTQDLINGSNSWVVSSAKTAQQQAILANDIHLDLSVPNILYRAMLQYPDTIVTGMLIPGVPALIIGSNQHIAWGVTNLSGDVLDLVRLDINPLNALEYKTPSGWKRFDKRQEVIHVRSGQDVQVDVQLTIWGPVCPRPLMTYPVALHWTALDPAAVDIGLTDMEQTITLDDALSVVHRTGGPPLNVMLADENGHIAWTCCGKLPIRQQFDGSTSESWADGHRLWTGYIPPEAMPTVIDPPEGFLVTANNRTVGSNYPYILGHNFVHSYRANHITQRLREMQSVTEDDMFQLQLDTTTHFYTFYQCLVLDILTGSITSSNPLLATVREVIEDWDGKMDVENTGISILVRFRNILMQEVFAPYVARCQQSDPTFTYKWNNGETPLRMLLAERIVETLPEPQRYQTWEEFLIAVLEEAIRQLQTECSLEAPGDLTWGRMNIAAIKHPLSGAFRHLGKILNMPRDPLPGGAFCVRVSGPTFGSAVRMVVSPGREDAGILHIPGGQSGYPLSAHFSDQHRFWVKGEPLPFLSSSLVHTLILKPGSRPLR